MTRLSVSIRIASRCGAMRSTASPRALSISRGAPLSLHRNHCIPRFKSTKTALSRRQKSTAVPSGSSMNQQVTARASVIKQLTDTLRSFLLTPRTIPVPRWVSPQHYTITLSEVFGHASFVLVAVSYAVDDFLQLRIIAVAGSTAMLFFTYFHPYGRVLWLPFKWNLLFIAINSYRIGKVYLDLYYANKLSPELVQIRDNHFYVLDPKDFSKLVRISRQERFQPGDVVVTQGKLNRYIRLVVDGELRVMRDGIGTYYLEEGNFVSEAGLHAGLLLHGKVISCCTIVATKPTHTLCWDRDELMNLLERDKPTRRALKAALSWDIVRKLKGQREMLARGKVENPEEWTQKRSEQTNDRYANILENMLHHPKYLRKRKDELNKYRMIHHIDDEHHRLALERCGWTPEEFEAGFKEGDDSFEEEKHDLKWRAQNWYRTVFG